MKNFDQVMKKLSELYEFNRRIRKYRVQNKPASDKIGKKVPSAS